jgi:hypothetical protein
MGLMALSGRIHSLCFRKDLARPATLATTRRWPSHGCNRRLGHGHIRRCARRGCWNWQGRRCPRPGQGLDRRPLIFHFDKLFIYIMYTTCCNYLAMMMMTLMKRMRIFLK